MNLFDRAVGSLDPSRPLLRTVERMPLSYGEVSSLSARLAHVLVARGVVPGDRVACQAEKSPAVLLLYLATLRAGAVFLPLNSAYTPREVAYFLEDAEPRVFVCDPKKREELTERCPRLGTASESGTATAIETLAGDGTGSLMESAGRADPDFPTVPRSQSDLAALLYTSGTTGRSKGAMLTHGNLLSNARALAECWRVTGDDVLLHALPLYHTHGLFVATNTLLVAGGSLLLLPKFDPPEVIRRLPEATVFMGIPTFYSRMLDRPELTRDATRSIRLFTSGSAPLSVDVHRRFLERTGHAILERYGMTETNMNTSNPYEGERIPGTVGLPLPGVDLRITDPASLHPVGRDEVGRIEVRGPHVFPGYWRMPEKTREEFRPDGFFVTGDLGRIDARGYLTIVGRSRDLIISGGLNVYPKEVEGEIDALPGVLESAVIGVPHPDFGEGVVAVVVADPAAPEPPAPEKLVETLRERLAPFKLPKRVVLVSELPRNAMGKVEKARLRERYRQLLCGPGDSA